MRYLALALFTLASCAAEPLPKPRAPEPCLHFVPERGKPCPPETHTLIPHPAGFVCMCDETVQRLQAPAPQPGAVISGN